MADGKPAVKLPFEAGEHLCTWDLPDGKGGVVPTPGLLNVEPNRWPSAVVYGEMPIVWRHEGATGVASFPQRHEFDCLVGQVSSGANVALMLGELSYWHSNQGRAIGALAVLSPGTISTEIAPRFSSIEFQIEGIEALVDATPIASFSMPVPGRVGGQEDTWSATVNSDASWSWNIDGVVMKVGFSYSIRGFDGYEFGMKSSPTIQITVPGALGVAEWWEQWVMPVRRFVSVATEAPRGVQYLFGFDGDDPRRLRRAQVFGMDIAQSPMDSVGADVRKVPSSVRVNTDDVSLLSLVMRWRELAAERHPMIETYGDLATMRDQHPRSRFLLLLQALEGLYGYETKEARDKRQAKYEVKRESFLNRVSSDLEAPDRKFLKKFLMKYLPDGLETALIAIFSALPVDVLPEFEGLELTAQVRGIDSSSSGLRVEAVLVKVRNLLAHGSIQFPPEHLGEAIKVLERVVRSEMLRILGAPESSRVRALQNSDH